ncbi:SLAIN motif-containing protein 1a isoform X1 [Thalassophryne amazonica]|uniref:SLAIN motif-containing protein 1a isoform X1 n=1 Tax=Thalassophryne amazonica TaxID=390379 RepID=UPI001471260E|nr:SLAIN motif-containing protein 1a isoform X1 [Thalassophryne amazonica]
MEADVLNPQIMADVNGNNKISGAELEVLKLQELVRKLEKQNEQLRTRANAVGPTALSWPHKACPGERRPYSEPIDYFQPSLARLDAAEPDGGAAGPATLLEELDLLDLNAVLPVGNPESWLYVSPKAKPQAQSSLSPLQWCRQVLDHPGPEVELAKMTLCHRLDQAKRWRGVSSVRPYSCIEGLSTISCPVLPYTKPAALTESPAPILSCSQALVPPALRASCSLSGRSPTFLSNATLHNAGRRHAAISPQSSVDSEAGVSELEDDSIMSYKLHDMTDVEVMARLQEESLRQDYASTSATTSRRSSSFSIQSLRCSQLDLEEEDEEHQGYDQLPPPQPRLFRTGSMQRGGLPHSHTFSSIRDCRRSSSSPQYSLSGLSQYSGSSSLTTETHTVYRNSTDKLRRSLPNLIRTPSMPSVPSIPCLASPVNPSPGPSSLPTMPSLRNSQSFDSSSALTRLQSFIPSPGQLSQRVQSVGNFPTMTRHPLKATAYVSPTVQQSPASTALTTSTSLHSIPSSAALPQPLKPSGSLVPQPLKVAANQPAVTRSSLPRPASFVGTAATMRSSKISLPTRSLLTPPKSLSALSTLRDGSWKDGCY